MLGILTFFFAVPTPSCSTARMHVPTNGSPASTSLTPFLDLLGGINAGSLPSTRRVPKRDSGSVRQLNMLPGVMRHPIMRLEMQLLLRRPIIRHLRAIMQLLLRLIAVCVPLSIPFLRKDQSFVRMRERTPTIGWVRGTVVFDSVIWVLPTAATSIVASALLYCTRSRTSQQPMSASGHRGGQSATLGRVARMRCCLPSWQTMCYTLQSCNMRVACEIALYSCVLCIIIAFFLVLLLPRLDALRYPGLVLNPDLVLKAVAFCLGPAGLLCTTVALLPSARGASLLAALGVPTSEAIRAHARLGRLACLCLFAHGVGYLIFWARAGGLQKVYSEATQWQRFGVNYLAGVISLFAGAGILTASAHPKLRMRWYGVFYHGHVLGAIVLAFFAAGHWTNTVFYLAPATLLWGVEIAQRSRQLYASRLSVQVTNIKGKLLRLCLPSRDDGPYPICDALSPNQYVYLKMSRNPLEKAHPFSVLPCHEGNQKLIYIRPLGTWTRQLLSLIQESAEQGQVGQDSLASVQVDMYVQGPYSINYPDEVAPGAHLILIGGGTGVTPLLGFLHARKRLLGVTSGSRRDELITRLVLVCAMLARLEKCVCVCGCVCAGGGGSASAVRDHN